MEIDGNGILYSQNRESKLRRRDVFSLGSFRTTRWNPHHQCFAAGRSIIDFPKNQNTIILAKYRVVCSILHRHQSIRIPWNIMNPHQVPFQLSTNLISNPSILPQTFSSLTKNTMMICKAGLQMRGKDLRRGISPADGWVMQEITGRRRNIPETVLVGCRACKW